MIVWLASYPRSGNTMFRMMLHQVFGCVSHSKYYSPEKFEQHNKINPASMGARPLPSIWESAYESMTRDPDCAYLVKTHDPPEDKQHAIYIVRNGLAAIRSYKHFLHDVNHVEYSLEQVIGGEPLFGSWGRHLDEWNPLERSNTLLLKYEDLVKCPDEQLQRVGDFIGLRRKTKWVNSFDDLHARNPKMYRQGPNVSYGQGFTEAQKLLFYALHGDWMARFGYSEPGFKTPRELRALLPERLQTLIALTRTAKGGPAVRAKVFRRILERAPFSFSAIARVFSLLGRQIG
jgi:hypothetical protein